MALSQSSVHYRFGNNGEFKTLLFDGIHISVDELKKSVAAQEGINLDYVDFTLTNANTQRVYDGPSIVPRNSCVAVVRVPRENPVKIPKISNTDSSGIIQIGFSNVPKTSHIKQETFTKMTEQERLLHAIAQSTEKYDPSNYKKRVTMPMNAKASPDHVCNKCNKLGHFPKQCPMLNFRLSTGIPSEELMETTQDDPHAMYHPSGRYVIPIMHYKARETRKLVDKVNYERQKLLSATASSLPGTADAEKPSTPDELKCPLCHDILNEAMLAPCCGESFCATCIHDFMLKGSLTEEGSRCPTCTPPKTISADSLIPNKRVRESVSRWQSVFKISPPTSVNIPSLPRIPSPIPLSAVVLEQKAATLNNNQVQDAPPVNKVPTVNLSAMLAKKEPLQASVPVFMQPLIPPMIPVSTVSVVPMFQQHFENKMTGKANNFSEKAPLQPGIEAIPSTTSASTTSTTAAPPGLTESSFDVEHFYKCPQVIDPQIQADEDAMSRAWDNVFNPDVTLDIFDLNKQQTIDNDKGKEAPKKRSDDKTDRRHYREHDSTRRKDRSRSRNRYGHRDRRYEDDRPRRGRSNRRYDDQRHYERDRRHYKEERHTSSRKQTRHEATPVEPDVVKVVEEVQEKEVVTETVPVETSNEIERPKSCESMALNIVIETAIDDSTPKPVISSSSVQVIQKSVSREPSAEKESKRSSSKKKKKKNKRKKHRSDDESVSEVSSEKKKKKKKKRSRHESDDDSEFEKEKRKKKKKKHHKKDRDSKKSSSSYEKDRRDSVRKSESATRSSRKHRRCDSDDDYHETTRKRRSSPGRQRDSRDYRR